MADRTAKDVLGRFADDGEAIADAFEYLGHLARNASDAALNDGDEELASHEADRAEQIDERAEQVRKAARLAGRFADRLPDDEG